MRARIGLLGVALGGCFCAVSTGLSAEDWLNRDVYARSHEPADSDAADKVLTAKIKRHMAQLMYPVDLKKFDPPARDPQFNDLIKELQKQMGVAATVILTEGEFRRLEEAASGINGEYVGLGVGKVFFLNPQNDWAVVDGTGVSDPPVADPFEYCPYHVRTPRR